MSQDDLVLNIGEKSIRFDFVVIGTLACCTGLAYSRMIIFMINQGAFLYVRRRVYEHHGR